MLCIKKVYFTDVDVEFDVTEKLDEGTIQPAKDYCVYIYKTEEGFDFKVSLNATYKVYIKESLEADDVIGILATSKTIIKGDKVVWSLDKDFKTIPCKFHRAKPHGKDESHLITQEAADWWFMYQTLIGDKVDGYEGCKGIGDKTARKLLGNIGEKPIKELWKIVLDTYLTHGYTEEDALRSARMARILRAEDYDFKTKQVRLWQMK